MSRRCGIDRLVAVCGGLFVLCSAPVWASTLGASVSLGPAVPLDAAVPISATIPLGYAPFTDHRNPPSYRALSEAESARFDLGHAVFNTQFVAAGTPGVGRRGGVGPLLNAASCDTCHSNGAHGRGPTEDGPAPTALVIQLATPSSRNSTDPEGDPVYGRVFNTAALPGVSPEGVAMIRYKEIKGRYPDGVAWTLRVPHYALINLHYGPLSPQTIVKPRLAPALFGVGLLDTASVDRDTGGGAPERDYSITASEHDTQRAPTPGVEETPGRGVQGQPAHSSQRTSAHGRFGWQATALSVRDQTERAFSREMGLTSTDMGSDDCTRTEVTCVQQPNGGSPEVSDDLLDAVVSFQRWLAVPASPAPHPNLDNDGKIFADLGCVACHRPKLRVTLTDAAGKSVATVIAPYTDLRLHEMGSRLADENVSGQKAPSKWRTAPLWGLGYRVSFERYPTFLHDGRARSAEEAILWHDGEAASARTRFEQLPAVQRKALVHWLETL